MENSQVRLGTCSYSRSAILSVTTVLSIEQREMEFAEEEGGLKYLFMVWYRKIESSKKEENLLCRQPSCSHLPSNTLSLSVHLAALAQQCGVRPPGVGFQLV